MTTIILGAILTVYLVLWPVYRQYAAERDAELLEKLRRDKLSALRRAFPILSGWSDSQIEEEFNIDRILYSH